MLKLSLQIATSFVALLLLAGSGTAQEEPIRSIIDIRYLNTEDAFKRLPVEARGIVIEKAQPIERSFILQQDDRNIYAIGDIKVIEPLKAGQEVIVKGTTHGGDYAPIITVDEIEIVGTAPLPKPTPVTLSELSAGGMDAQWIETTAIVRTCRPIETENATILKLAQGKERIVARIQSLCDPDTLVDAEITLQGFCFNQHNNNRQFVRPVLLIPRRESLQIDKQSANPFHSPSVSASSLLTFSPNTDFRHRVHIRGIVTHSIPGTAFWIRDESRSLMASTNQADALRIGDVISAAGFPTWDSFSPTLEDATFQVVKNANPPEPIVVSSYDDALEYDQELIRIEASIIEKQQIQGGVSIRLEMAGHPDQSIPATIMTSKIGVVPEIGSRVILNGICTVTPSEISGTSGRLDPSRFELLLRQASDIQVIKDPPFWNPQRIAWSLFLVLICAIAISIAVWLWSRAQLKEQALRRKMAETEFRAILEERNRVAREIHDTLSQGLGAISVQLELARSRYTGTNEPLLHHMSTAHQLARSTLKEARTSIWDMRSQVLEKSDLADALKAILDQLTKDTGVVGTMHVEGERKRMSPVVENNLLRIGQEAITNATKHAQPKTIHVQLSFKGRRARLSVSDDGSGFDTKAQINTSEHFGLTGIRERMDRLGGQLAIDSVPGKGTTVNVQIDE